MSFPNLKINVSYKKHSLTAPQKKKTRRQNIESQIDSTFNFAMSNRRRLEDILASRLAKSRPFKTLVQYIYYKIHPDQKPAHLHYSSMMSGSQGYRTMLNSSEYRPTRYHKFNALRILFLDEMRTSFFLPHRTTKGLKKG